MNIKIKMPDDLRAEVEGFIPCVRKQIEEAQTKDSGVAIEAGKLQAQQAEVSREIEALRTEALDSSEKAAALTVAEKRLYLVEQRLAELKQNVLNAHQVKMWGLSDLLARIGRHWLNELPGMISSALAPFCSDEHNAKTAGLLCNCISTARHVRYLHYDNPNPIATERNIQWAEKILNRALRGQPHLGVDYQEDAQTTPSAETAEAAA